MLPGRERAQLNLIYRLSEYMVTGFRDGRMETFYWLRLLCEYLNSILRSLLNL